METESRNLDWNNVLSVIERHTYRRPISPASSEASKAAEHDSQSLASLQKTEWEKERTDVDVTVTLKSRIGEQIRKRRQRWGEQATATSVIGGEAASEEGAVKQGWFSSWSSGAVRSAVEAISLQRTERSQPKAKLGMSVVLARLREGGLQAVLEGMERDREIVL